MSASAAWSDGQGGSTYLPTVSVICCEVGKLPDCGLIDSTIPSCVLSFVFWVTILMLA